MSVVRPPEIKVSFTSYKVIISWLWPLISLEKTQSPLSLVTPTIFESDPE